MNSQVLSAPCRVQTRCPSLSSLRRKPVKPDPDENWCRLEWQILVPGFRGGTLLGGSCAVLCHTHFLQTLKIYGVVNNDLILFSMLVIYFRIYILVYFRLWSICFALLWLQGFKQCFSGVPSLRTRAVYLMLWITFSKCLIFLKKINILFLLGVSRNAVFIYFFWTHKSNTLKVQNCHIWWKRHCDENRLHWL